MASEWIDGSAPDYYDGPDLVQIGKWKLAGKSRVAATLSYKVDARDAKGKSAARPSFHGLDRTTKLVIENSCTTKRQRDINSDINLTIGPSRGGEPVPYRIQSEQIDDMDITHVVVTGCSEWSWIPGEKAWRRRWECLVWAGEEHIPGQNQKAGKKTQTQTPTRAIRNRRSEDAERRRNPPPSAQPVKP